MRGEDLFLPLLPPPPPPPPPPLPGLPDISTLSKCWILSTGLPCSWALDVRLRLEWGLVQSSADS